MGIYWKPEKAGKGDATEKNHIDWIKVASVSFGSGRQVKEGIGRDADRQVSTGQIGEVTIVKSMDTSSMNLFRATCFGSGEKMELHLTRAGELADKAEVVYLKYVLENTLLTGYAFSSTGGLPSETVTLNFTKLTMTYTPQDAAVSGASPISVSFDKSKTTPEGA